MSNLPVPSKKPKKQGKKEFNLYGYLVLKFFNKDYTDQVLQRVKEKEKKKVNDRKEIAARHSDFIWNMVITLLEK